MNKTNVIPDNPKDQRSTHTRGCKEKEAVFMFPSYWIK